MKEGANGFRIWQMDSTKMIPYLIGALLDDERQMAESQNKRESLEKRVDKLTDIVARLQSDRTGKQAAKNSAAAEHALAVR